MRARPGHGVAREIESREGEECEWAAPSQENINYVRPDSANRTSSASHLRLPQRHLSDMGNLIGEVFNPQSSCI